MAEYNEAVAPAAQPEPTPICNGNCKLVGFILEWCETCGWSDEFTGTPE